MNNDLISREELKEEFKGRCICNCDRCKYYTRAYCGLIDNAPTVEQPTGEKMIDRTYRDDPYEYMSQEPCDYCPYGNIDKNENTESEETKMENMTVDQYRERLIQAFQNTGNDNLIALVCLPNEDSFKALESLLRNFWNKGGEGE